MILELKKSIIYGPVSSRRLGRSLGLNILPASIKVCPFNCVYCQYGWTKYHGVQSRLIYGWPSIRAVKKALAEALHAMSQPPDYITFSGNGEPTMHPDFQAMVNEVISVRNQLAPRSKTAILSNSALVPEEAIRDALLHLDVRIMKLDCGKREMFKKYNQPCKDLDLEEITDGLAKLSESSAVTIQTLFSSGAQGNLESSNITAWIRRLKSIRPASVQLYTLDRGYPAHDLKAAARKGLLRIEAMVREANMNAHVF